MNILQQFADFAATKSGRFQTKNCAHCPMAEFTLSLYPDAERVIAGESGATVWFGKSIKDVHFGTRFFTRFVETAGTWEELTARLRRAAQ